MDFQTIVSADILQGHMDDPGWAIIDCRFSLADSDEGERTYREAHIPGAAYAHLDYHLSGPIVPGKTGRHPLPDVHRVTETFSKWGIDDQIQVVTYDDRGGAIAARLWWLLRWLGHDRVAVLDGGWSNWVSAGKPTSDELVHRKARTFVPRIRPELLMTVEEVMRSLENDAIRLLDSRAPERYHGAEEPFDSFAGHIPGAISCPYAHNLDDEGNFLSIDRLRARFKSSIGTSLTGSAVFYCGSGVTGAHNVLAYLHAGLGESKLYAGSWSEWITDSQRPTNPKRKNT